jgi:hypothetical protein
MLLSIQHSTIFGNTVFSKHVSQNTVELSYNVMKGTEYFVSL